MPHAPALKSRALDDIDRKILDILSQDSRTSLTSIARSVNRSIDSVNKRIKELRRKGIFEFGVFIEPRNIGYPFVADVKIKLHNITQKEKDSFITYLKGHPHVIDLISLMGDFDFTAVVIAKDAKQLDHISTQVRQKYSTIIADWKAMLIIEQLKFEDYDLDAL